MSYDSYNNIKLTLRPDLDYRNISAEGTEIAGEVAVYDWNIEFKRDKLGGNWS